MRKLLDTSNKGFIYKEGMDLIIPMVNGYVNQELYQACYNWVSLYYKLPIRFFPLFKCGALKQDEIIAQAMETIYGVNCSPAMLLKIYNTYFKEDRDLRAIALAYAEVFKYLKLSDELKDNFAYFLDSTENRLRHINYIARIKTESVIQKSIKHIDLSLRMNRSNLVETLLILETAENPYMMGRLIDIFQGDFEVMLSLPEYGIKENLSVYVWFFDKILTCEKEYKSLKGFEYVRLLCRTCKKLSKTLIYEAKDFDSIRRVFPWSDEMIRYINFICLTHLREKHYGAAVSVPAREYVQSAAILFSNLIRRADWLEEAEIIFDLYELGQRHLSHRDLMQYFIQDLDKKEPLEFFEQAYAICSRYPSEATDLIRCGFLRNKNCSSLPQMNEDEVLLTFYNKLIYLSPEEVSSIITKEEIINILSSENISNELACKIYSKSFLDTTELADLILSNSRVTKSFYKALNYSKSITPFRPLVKEVLSHASFCFLNVNLKMFIPTYRNLGILDPERDNLGELIEIKAIKEDNELVDIIALKIVYYGLLKDYESFYKILAIYLRDHKEMLGNAQEVLKNIAQYSKVNNDTLKKIASNILTEEQYKEFEDKLLEEENIAENIKNQKLQLVQMFSGMVENTRVRDDIEESLAIVTKEFKDDVNFVQRLFEILLEKVYEITDYEEEEEYRQMLEDIATEYNVDLYELEEG